MWKWLVLFWAAGVTLTAGAQVYVSGRETLVLSSDSGPARVEWLKTAADGFPEVTRARDFASVDLAREFLRRTYPRVRRQNTEALASVVRPRGVDGEHLWDVTESWSWAWEERMAEWVRQEVDAQFFVRHNISTDCADVAYALRWIFARMHGLPMRSRLAAGVWLTDATVREKWLTLPHGPTWDQDPRFLAALDYLLNLTYTHTLNADAYPVAIRPGVVLEGGFHLSLFGPSGHTRPITHVAREGESGYPLMILQSTVPRAVRALASDGYWITETPQRGHGGLLRFRWPRASGDGLIAATDMPNYSDEQYTSEFRAEASTFYLAVLRRLQPGFSLDTLVSQLFESTASALRGRQEIVRDGFAACAQGTCKEGSDGWENWSTPSRDGRIGEQLAELQRLGWQLPDDVRARLDERMHTPLLTEDGRTYTLEQIRWAWDNKMFSSDPADTPAVRWGLAPEAVVTIAERRARALWAQREAKLAETSNCPADTCRPGTPTYRQRATQDLDVSLQALSQLETSYCGQMPADACADLGARLARPTEWLRTGETLRSTFARFLRLNSDPRLSTDVRRDGRPSVAEPLVFPWASEISTSATHLFARLSEGRIYDLRGPTPRPRLAPEGFTWRDAYLGEGVAWAAQGPTLTRVDLNRDDVATLSLGFTPNTVRALPGGRAIAWADQFAVVGGSPLTVAHSGAVQAAVALDDSHVLLTMAEQTVLLDASGADLRLIPLDTHGFTLKPATVLPSLNGWFLTTADARVAWLSSTGRVYVPEAPTARIYMAARAHGDLIVGLARETFERWHFTPETNTLTREALKNAHLQNRDEVGLMYHRGSQMVTLLARDGELREYATKPGEDAVVDAQGSWVSVQKGGDFVVRAIDADEPLMTSHAAITFVVRQPAAHALARVCDLVETMDMNNWQHACRVVDLEHPDRFSLITGVAVFSLNVPGRTFQRGALLGSGQSTLWYDRLN